MITVLEKRRDDQVPPKIKIKTYIYKCDCCGSTIKFDNTDIVEVIEWGDEESYVQCPVCGRKIDIWWVSKWRHRLGIWRLFHLFHRMKKNKEE